MVVSTAIAVFIATIAIVFYFFDRHTQKKHH